jgi:hypothetical protein
LQALRLLDRFLPRYQSLWLFVELTAMGIADFHVAQDLGLRDKMFNGDRVLTKSGMQP